VAASGKTNHSYCKGKNLENGGDEPAFERGGKDPSMAWERAGRPSGSNCGKGEGNVRETQGCELTGEKDDTQIGIQKKKRGNDGGGKEGKRI